MLLVANETDTIPNFRDGLFFWGREAIVNGRENMTKGQGRAARFLEFRTYQDVFLANKSEGAPRTRGRAGLSQHGPLGALDGKNPIEEALLTEESGDGRAPFPLFGDMDRIVRVIEEEYNDISTRMTRLGERRDEITDELERLLKRFEEAGKAHREARKMAEFLGSIKHFREAVEIDKKAKIGSCLILPGRKMGTN
jgi:hypothetical protein